MQTRLVLFLFLVFDPTFSATVSQSVTCPPNSTLRPGADASNANVSDCLCDLGYEGAVVDSTSSCTACPADTYRGEGMSSQACADCRFGKTTNGLTAQTNCTCLPGLVYVASLDVCLSPKPPANMTMAAVPHDSLSQKQKGVITALVLTIAVVGYIGFTTYQGYASSTRLDIVQKIRAAVNRGLRFTRFTANQLYFGPEDSAAFYGCPVSTDLVARVDLSSLGKHSVPPQPASAQGINIKFTHLEKKVRPQDVVVIAGMNVLSCAAVINGLRKVKRTFSDKTIECLCGVDHKAEAYAREGFSLKSLQSSVDSVSSLTSRSVTLSLAEQAGGMSCQVLKMCQGIRNTYNLPDPVLDDSKNLGLD